MASSRLRRIVLLAALLGGTAALPAGGQSRPVLTMPQEIDGSSVYAAIAPDAIRAIDAPAFLAGPAGDRQMAADEPVLGVARGGEARAYPLGFLTAHEIVNDRFGDLAVAITW